MNSLNWNPLLSPKTIHLGVFIQATLGVVSQRKVHEFQGLLNGDISNPSTCLASAQLFQTLDTIPGTIKVAGETLLWSTTLDQLQHPTTLENDPNVRGAVLEFNATGQSIILRTVATLVPGQWGNNTTPPVAEPAPVHPRGYWPYSSLQLNANEPDPAYDVNPFGGSPPIQYCSVCEAGGPEHDVGGFLVQSLLDQYGRTNYGCFGADLEYTFYVTNSHPTNSYPCYVGMRARNSGAKYWGAAKVTAPSPWLETQIDKIPIQTADSPPLTQAANDLLFGRTPNYFVVAPSQTVLVRVKVANGGSATMPVNLFVSRYNISLQDPEVPEE